MPKRNYGIIGKRAARNYPFLYQIFQTKSPRVRLSMAENATNDELGALIDVCANISSGSFELTKRQCARLANFAKVLKKLGNVRSRRSAIKHIQKGEGISLKRKKIVQIQRGGFIPAVLAPVLVELAADLAERLIPDPSPDD